MNIVKLALYGVILASNSAFALDASLYYPFQAGNQWTYSDNRTDGPGTGISTNTVTVNSGVFNVNGANTTRVSETDGDATYYTSDTNGVKVHREYDGEDLIQYTFSPAFKTVNANFNIGDNITGQTGTITSIVYGSLPYTASSSVANGGTVSVTAGTFTNTVKVTTTVVVNTSSLTGFTSNVTDQKIIWFAEHIGPVQATYEYTDSTDSNERIFETSTLTSTNVTVPTGSAAHDHNGDGMSDVMVRHTDGRWFYFPMNGRNVILAQQGGAALTTNNSWQYQGSGDYNGDGKADILVRHTDGRWFYFPMNGKAVLIAQQGGANLTTNNSWQYQGSGDMNGDGKDDVLVRHTDGRWFYFPMNGRTVLTAQQGIAKLTTNTAWQFAGMGDMNGDGKDDVLVRHTDGRWFYFPMNGRNVIVAQQGIAGITTNTAWQFAGAGDMNGDGKDDVLVRHTDGRWFYFPMNGRTAIVAQQGIAKLTTNTAWQFAGMRDMNGDGKDDVLVRHTDGRWFYFPMNGRNVIIAQQGAAALTTNTAWGVLLP